MSDDRERVTSAVASAKTAEAHAAALLGQIDLVVIANFNENTNENTKHSRDE